MAQVALVSMNYGGNEHSLLQNTYSSTLIVDQLHTKVHNDKVCTWWECP